MWMSRAGRSLQIARADNREQPQAVEAIARASLTPSTAGASSGPTSRAARRRRPRRLVAARGDAERGGDGRARRPADEQPLLARRAAASWRSSRRRSTRSAASMTPRSRMLGRGARADALDRVGGRRRRAAPVRTQSARPRADRSRRATTLHAGHARLEEPADAGDGAAGADAGDERADASAGLLEDLGAGRRLVGAHVGRVAELVGEEPAVLGGEARGDVLEVVGVAGRRVRRDDDPRAERGERRALVGATSSPASRRRAQ